MSPALAAESLREEGAHPAHIAAMHEGMVGVRCRPRLGWVEGDLVPLEVGVRQGGPRTPSLWNSVLALAVNRLLQKRATADDGAVAWCPAASESSLLLWAENIFLMASDAGVVQKRTTDIRGEFAALRLGFHEHSLEFVASAAADHMVDIRLGDGGPQFRRRDAMWVIARGYGGRCREYRHHGAVSRALALPERPPGREGPPAWHWPMISTTPRWGGFAASWTSCGGPMRVGCLFTGAAARLL